MLELRIDEKTNVAYIQDQVIPLQGLNVLLIDDVDSSAVRISTAWIDPMLDLSRDPVSQLLKQSALLSEFAGR